jgi:hypothetical protein
MMTSKIAIAIAVLVAMTGAANAQKFFTTDTPNHKANVVALILVHRQVCKTSQALETAQLLDKLQKEKAYPDQELDAQMGAMKYMMTMEGESAASWCRSMDRVVQNPAKHIE